MKTRAGYYSHFLYYTGWLLLFATGCMMAGYSKARQFSMPVISVGNLEVGGAGKSPMTEYLVRLFKDEYKLATLSRGMAAKPKVFVLPLRCYRQLLLILVTNLPSSNINSRILPCCLRRQGKGYRTA